MKMATVQNISIDTFAYLFEEYSSMEITEMTEYKLQNEIKSRKLALDTEILGEGIIRICGNIENHLKIVKGYSATREEPGEPDYYENEYSEKEIDDMIRTLIVGASLKNIICDLDTCDNKSCLS